jgi:hypothetical protein
VPVELTVERVHPPSVVIAARAQDGRNGHALPARNANRLPCSPMWRVSA